MLSKSKTENLDYLFCTCEGIERSQNNVQHCDKTPGLFENLRNVENNHPLFTITYRFHSCSQVSLRVL